jgi:hypothetical protein
MLFAIHKFKHYLLNNMFVFYVDHLELVNLVKKQLVLRCLVQWILFFLEYGFIMVYKWKDTHVVMDC